MSPVSPVKTASYEQSDGMVHPLGCLDVDTRHGTVHFHDAPGIMCSEINRKGIPSTIGVMVYQGGPGWQSPGDGMVVQLDAGGARQIAASLLRLANELEPLVTN